MSSETMKNEVEDEQNVTEGEEVMPEPRKKIYRRRLKGTLPSATIVTLTVLATGDRPLARAINQAMNSSGEMYTDWHETPSNDTDAMGDAMPEFDTTTPFTTERWTLPMTTPSTKKPSALVVLPSAVMNYANFKYEFFKNPWTLEVAIGICQRRNAHLIYIDSKEEMERTRDWIRFEVTDKLPYWRAGYYWTAGMSINSNPLEGNYDWFWRGGIPKSGYTNFCPDYTSNFPEEFYKNSPEKRLNIVMDFHRFHYLEPTMGCWKVAFQGGEVLDENHKDDAGNPFICKLPSVN